MDRLAYTALSATISSAKQRVQLTNNLANLNTVGFKMTSDIQHSASKVDGLGLRRDINQKSRVTKRQVRLIFPREPISIRVTILISR